MTKVKVSSTYQMNREKLVDFCGMMYAVDILGGRWKLLILYKLQKKTLRFLELKKHLPGITDRMLTLHLRELEKNGLVNRVAYAEAPPRVEYNLTASARELIPVWLQLEKWGLAHKEVMETTIKEKDKVVSR